MIRQEIGTINGEKMVFCQCETQDEAAKNGFPKGVYFCWEKPSGERIFSPFHVVKIIQNAVLSNAFDPAKLINKAGVQEFYKNMVSAQKKAIVDYLETMKSQYKGVPGSEEILKQIDDMIIEHGQGELFPGMDGIVRVNKDQAVHLSGGIDNLKEAYSDQEISENFPEAR